MGGVHVSNDIEKIKADLPFIEFIFSREGDVSFTNFIKNINGENTNLNGFVYKDSESWINSGVNTVPSVQEIDLIPLYELVTDLEDYSKYGMVGSFYWTKGESKAATILSNRGCRAQCTFCSVRNFNGVGVRQRSIESVIEELKYLKYTRNIDHVMFLDDDLFKSQERTVLLFNAMVKANLSMTWDATNGVIAYACTPEVVSAAAESGCIGVNIGMESGNPNILKSVKKPGTVENFIQAAHEFKKFPSIITSVFLIIGFPNETISQISDTIQVSKEMDLDWYRTQLLSPLPNTPIFEEMLKLGLITEEEKAPRWILGSYGTAKNIDKLADANFYNVFKQLGKEHIPTGSELADIWFYMDYHLNYKRLFEEKNHIKIKFF